MNLLSSPYKFFWAGLICVLLGFLLPLLWVMGLIERSIALGFLIYILQFVGMILGIIAAAGIAIRRRSREKKKPEDDTKEEEREDTVGWMK